MCQINRTPAPRSPLGGAAGRWRDLGGHRAACVIPGGGSGTAPGRAAAPAPWKGRRWDCRSPGTRRPLRRIRSPPLSRWSSSI